MRHHQNNPTNIALLLPRNVENIFTFVITINNKYPFNKPLNNNYLFEIVTYIFKINNY